MSSALEDNPNTPPSALAEGVPADLAGLARAVRAVDPRALLVPPRILRRVIKEHCHAGGFAFRLPHRKSYVIGRAALLEIVDKGELGLRADEDLPEPVILLAQPDPRKPAAATADAALLRCWRLLFHARVHVALEEQLARGQLTPAVVRRRIHQIGVTEFEEIRAVLQQEGFLLPPRSDESTYVEFAAVYLELRHFAWGLLRRYFPGIDNQEYVERIVAQDLDADALFRATRPPGAAEPKEQTPRSAQHGLPAEADIPEPHELPRPREPAEEKYRRWLRRAQRPAVVGNVVGAAICRARAAYWAPPEQSARVRAALKADVHHLIHRLQLALEIRAQGSQPWHEALSALVNQTPRGFWTAEARLLYDLQKVCVDHERDLHTVDLVEWAISLGRRPIKRPLPQQRDVLMCKHLRSAARRLATVRLAAPLRQQLSALLEEATGRVEQRVRDRFRPLLHNVLDEVGLRPQNLPERVARKKIVEELLDQTVERGFLTISHLRDAVSRNNLKLPDLVGWGDLLRGDQVLCANRRLSVAMDGVYHGAEFYLRWMQRLSFVGFGTRLGRLFTLHVAIPFGGVFVVLKFLEDLTERIAGIDIPAGPFWIGVACLGVFLWGLVHLRVFRRGVWQGVKLAARAFYYLTIWPVVWLVRWPLLRRILGSRPLTLSFRFLIKPAAFTAVICWLLPMRQSPWTTSAGTAAAIFLGLNLLLNSRLGRSLEEMLSDWLAQAWQRYGLRLVLGLFYLIVDFFKAVLEHTERLLYAVDEWLRFRTGESRLSLVLKAALGLAWFFVTYVIRFAITLLVEPQVNPIKHFPVVTASHKVIWPGWPYYIIMLQAAAEQFGYTISDFWAWFWTGAVIWGIPGIFGFLVWELKENWRLYAANRPANLRPAMIGSHGETMGRLLKPGFHSGTVPKRFAKLRRAERRAREKGSWKKVRKHLDALHHVERSIRRFVERELLTLLAEGPWQGPLPAVAEIRQATNRVEIALACPGPGGPGLRLCFEVQSGWLLAEVADCDWVPRLSPQQREVLDTALLGLLKAAGADLLRRQIEAALPRPTPEYAAAAQGLRVWPDATLDAEVLYRFRDGTSISPQAVFGSPGRLLPTLQRDQLLFREVPLPWQRWVEMWEPGNIGGRQDADALAPCPILPAK